VLVHHSKCVLWSYQKNGIPNVLLIIDCHAQLTFETLLSSLQ
jgi:hypothetical protein